MTTTNGHANGHATPRPQAPAVHPDAIPATLREQSCWVVWRYVPETDPETGAVEWDKPPFEARTGRMASTADPRTWCDFAQALTAYQAGGWDGLGYVLHREPGEEGGLVGIDLDKCRDPETGTIEPWARDVLDRLSTYTEVSPSRRGVRAFVWADLPAHGRKKGAYENYQSGRYVTVTGQRLAQYPAEIGHRQGELATVHKQVFGPAPAPAASSGPRPGPPASDLDLVRLASEARGGERFRQLWNGDASAYVSASEADLALVNYLAFWCAGDEARIDELFRASGLFRSKWNRDDYRARTIRKALDGRTEFYEPAQSAGRIKPTAPRNGTSEAQEVEEGDATAADLVRINATIRWLWPSWIPLGVLTILASEPGIGKTRLCADLLRRINLGLPWPDETPATLPAGSVALWVAADNQHPELGTIPKEYGFPLEALYLNASRSNPFGGTMLDDPEDLKAFERRIVRIGAKLIFIDTSLNATDRSSHKPEDAKAFFVPLQQIAARTGTAIVCVTHLNAAGKPLGRRIEGQGRVVIMLERPDPEEQPKRRKLYVRKSNSLYPPALGVTMGDAGNTYDTNPPKAPETVEAGPQKVSRLSQAVRHLSEMLEDGAQLLGIVRKAMAEVGFSVDLFCRARQILKLNEYKSEGLTWIELPK